MICVMDSMERAAKVLLIVFHIIPVQIVKSHQKGLPRHVLKYVSVEPK